MILTTSARADWKPAAAPLMTRWAAEVDPAKPLPEYPRPQLVREKWMNLNGLWRYAIVHMDDAKPAAFEGSILVPFAIESALSGVGKRVMPEQALWYQRTFPTPDNAPGERTLLHFGGVDWETHVYVNGKLVVEHRGGHTPFSADITHALRSSGENELVVRVWDPTGLGSQPRGKQVLNPHGIWYTPVTGIWQTVWLETVPAVSIDRLKLTPDIDAGTLTVVASIGGTGDVAEIEVIARDCSNTVGTATGKSGGPVVIQVPNARLWSPDSPFLYDLVVRVKQGDKVVDEVKSYFAMRKISLGKDAAGYERLMLNNEPLFHFGPLDQGWWPDGLYTAPTDEALAWDIKFTKDLGLNMCRKHIKVEPARWYYHCDRLGLMVWQDQSSGMAEGRDQGVAPGRATDGHFMPQETVQFRRELKEMMDALYNAPSVVVWVPFNEGWGQHDTNHILQWTKAYDPTRLVNGPSGWEDRGFGDMIDMHNYPGPGMHPVRDGRASVLGEFGGLGWPVPEHLWQPNQNWGYRTYDSAERLNAEYLKLMDRLGPLAARGLAAAVYTQTTDVEGEVNGYATYDRKQIKFDLAKLAAVHRKIIADANRPTRFVELAPTSKAQGQTYSYTFDQPAAGWEKPAFDDSAWKRGPGGFGSQGTPNSMARTEWTTSDIYLRRTIRLDEVPERPTLLLRHDEDVVVYINGLKALEAKGHIDHYAEYPVAAEARKALKAGENVVAIHCRQTTGGQMIDFGLGESITVEVTPRAK